jgi:hypothetical protein
MPHTEELAMLIVGDFSLEKYKRDIIVSSKNKGLQRIFFFIQHTWCYNTLYYFHMEKEDSN